MIKNNTPVECRNRLDLDFNLKMRLTAVLSLLAMVPAAFAQHKRSPFGMAAGTTGGGSATPVWPNTNAE